VAAKKYSNWICSEEVRLAEVIPTVKDTDAGNCAGMQDKCVIEKRKGKKKKTTQMTTDEGHI
jgi:hypothetical protein